jgi:hypothetical protein
MVARLRKSITLSMFATRAVMATALVSLVPLVSLVSACVVNEGAPPATGVVVNAPPPEPVREPRPVAARRTGGEWVSGYWHWNGMQYTWIPGHWEKAPPGQSWHAPRYSLREGGTYIYEPGGWK